MRDQACKPLVCSLLEHVRTAPKQPAFLAGERVVSFGEFGGWIAAIAKRLRARGLRAGDRALLVGANSVPWAAAYFALHAVGAVAVPVDPASPIEKTRWLAQDCEAATAVVTGEPLPLPLPMENVRDIDATAESPFLTEPVCRPHDVADLLYTSGTTGRKKGVLLTHANLASAAANVNAFVQSRPADVEVVPIPLSHSFGLGRLRCMAQTGNTLALEAGLWNAARLLKRVLDLRANGLALVPAGFDLLLRMTQDRLGDAKSHLRYIEIGSAAMRPENKQKLMRLLPATRICHHYGLTEASRAAFCEYHADRDHLDAIGRASPNVEIAVRDAEGKELAAGERGELTVRGGMVMREYWKQPELTAKTLRDNWLFTGDLGYRDSAGRLYLVGRKSDLINVGGLKVSPEEVEEALREHPQVVDAACIGEPDPNGITGECVKAFIVSGEPVSTTELVAWLRHRVEEYKIPRLWSRTGALPKTPSGKIQRHLLRTEGADNGS